MPYIIGWVDLEDVNFGKKKSFSKIYIWPDSVIWHS